MLGVVAFVVLRSVEAKDRRPREESIRARWKNRPDFPHVVEDVDAYVARFGDDLDARWLACEAYARAGAASKGFDAIWDDPRLATDPATPGRLAGLLLRSLAEGPEGHTALYTKSVLARVEGGDPGAREELTESARKMTMPDVVFFFKVAHRAPTSAIPVLGAAWLSREGDRSARIAGTALLGHAASSNAGDLMVQAMTGEWPFAKRAIWLQMIRALAVSDDPRAVETLQNVRDAVQGDTEAADAERVEADVGLALARVPGALERLLAKARSDPKWMFAYMSYGEGLVYRLSRGDAKALAEIETLWNLDPGLQARLALAYGCFLGDAPLPGGVPADAWCQALLAYGRSDIASLVHAYRYRVRAPGDPKPLADLVDGLREALREPSATLVYSNGEDGPSFVVAESLRALFRWSPK